MDISSAINVTTTSPAEVHEPTKLHWLIFGGITLSIIQLTNLIGNSLTIVTFCVDKKLQIISNMYIINLAVNDLLIGVVSEPLYGTYSLMNFYWPFGYPMCKFYIMVDYISCAGSSAAVLLISLDRYLLVTEGINYSLSQTKKKAGIKIAIAWGVIVPLYVTFTLFYDMIRGHSTVKSGSCDEEFGSDGIFNTFLSAFEFLIPLVFISVLNFKVYYNIHKRTKAKVGPMEKQEVSTISETASTSEPKEEKASHVRLLKRDRRAARSLATLVIIYFICWGPYTIFTILIAFYSEQWEEDNWFIPYESVIWLLWLNSSLNPILYAFTVPAFKQAYKRFLCKCWHGRQGKSSHSRQDSNGIL